MPEKHREEENVDSAQSAAISQGFHKAVYRCDGSNRTGAARAGTGTCVRSAGWRHSDALVLHARKVAPLDLDKLVEEPIHERVKEHLARTYM